MKTDKELLESFLLDQDKKAFEVFYGKYFSYFYKRTFPYIKNEEDRKDFLQDFWLHVLSHAAQLKTDEKGAAIAYLNVAYTHDIYDFFKRKSWSTVSLDDEILRNLQNSDSLTYNDVDDYIYSMEIQEEKSLILKSMPEINQRIYNLFEKHKLSIQEIAQYFSLSEGTVRNKISTTNNYINKHLRSTYLAISILNMLFKNL